MQASFIRKGIVGHSLEPSDPSGITSAPPPSNLVRDRAAVSHCSQSNDVPLSRLSAIRLAGLFCTIPTGTLFFVGRDANVDPPR